SVAAALSRARRAPVRHLHAGISRGRQGPAREEARSDRDRGPLLAGRQPLPVHRIRQDRQRGAGRRRDDEKGLTMAETTNGHSQYIGTRTIRPDGVDKVTGRARFAADFDLPGLPIGRVLRSPHAHARIVSIDLTKPAALPPDDLFTAGVEPKPDKPSNVAKRVEITLGDIDAGFEKADVIVEREFKTAPVHQGYIEPHAAVGSVSEDGVAELWCTTQGHFIVRAHCAKLLGMDIGKIRVTATEIGGGFGGKTVVYLEPLTLALSRKAKRPVKM